jgi:hypothetical protein
MSMSYGDYEICATNYPHPDIHEGQHTNGPPSIWVRYKGGQWLCTDEKHMHKVRAAIDTFGAAFMDELLKE